MATILLADSNDARRAALAGWLRARGSQVVESHPRHAVRAYEAHRAHAMLLSASDGHAAVATITEVRRRDARACIVLLVDGSSEALAVAALRAGAKDYLAEPVSPEEVGDALTRAVARRRDPRPEVRATATFVGASAEIADVRERLGRVAAGDSTVLITGETGTGKELAAALLHAGSPRRQRRFVPVNCAAIPDSLLESELFGHERGAFTGAATSRTGMLQQAQGGTVFLDEVGEMSALGQAKLLRAIETREIVPVGARAAVPIDIRVVAATNQDLDEAVRKGTFRKDLYFRLNVVRIHLPPLRQRSSDVPALLSHFLEALTRRSAGAPARFSEDALVRLTEYGWPGNVRELKNLVEAVIAEGVASPIGVADLPCTFRDRLPAGGRAPGGDRERLIAALIEARWNKSRAARQLHCSRMTLYRWMAREKLQGEK